MAVIDTGVDANSPPFRGRVAPGKNVFTNGFGNDDTSSAERHRGRPAGPPGGTGGGGTRSTATVDGHGTLVAGVVAQFVPQATIVPVNIFDPFVTLGQPVHDRGGTGGGRGHGGAGSLNVNVERTSRRPATSTGA